MFRLLFVGLLAGLSLWLSVEEAHCQNVDKDVNTKIRCYNTSSGGTCFTTFIDKDNQLERKPFEAARDLCNTTVPGSSLIKINSLEDQRIVGVFIESQELLANETIVIDAKRFEARDSLEWYWVNGQSMDLKSFINETTLLGLDVACVESKHRQSLIYCAGTQLASYRYICENSDSRQPFSYQHKKSYYFASNESATWYDARNECLRLRGDLASITDLRMLRNGSWLKENERYWIGLHRYKWIWNSTGAALTYTNWGVGHFDEASSENKCICINPLCKKESNGTTCYDNRKWKNCNCANKYTIVCQKDDTYDALATEKVVPEVMLQSTNENYHVSTTENVVTEVMLQSTSRPTIRRNHSTRTGSSRTTRAATPVTTASSTETSKARPTTQTTATSSTKTDVTTTPITVPASTETAIATAFTETPSPSLFQGSFGKMEILIVVLLFVAVVFIIVAVIVVIRKRRRVKRNETSPTENTKQDETVTSVYATVDPDNKPSEVTAPAASPTYAEVVKTQQPAPSNNTSAEVQMTQQPAPSNHTSAEVQMTQQPEPSNNTYADVHLVQQPANNTYAEVTQRPTPFNNDIYANVQPTNEAAEMGRDVVYVGLDLPQPNGKAVEEEEPIYLQAMDMKHEAESEEDGAAEDLGPVYAESMKLNKSP